MTKVVTHLLDERDATQYTELGGGMMWWATWFPFSATVTNYNNTLGRFNWGLKLQGAQSPFRTGEEETWSGAFQAVADAKKEALKALVEQLAEVSR